MQTAQEEGGGMITIFDFADIIDREIQITYYPNQAGRFAASFIGGEIKEYKDSGILVGMYGNGKTADEAVQNYAQRISGKTLVVNAMSKERAEYKIPVFKKEGAAT